MSQRHTRREVTSLDSVASTGSPSFRSGQVEWLEGVVRSFAWLSPLGFVLGVLDWREADSRIVVSVRPVGYTTIWTEVSCTQDDLGGSLHAGPNGSGESVGHRRRLRWSDIGALPPGSAAILHLAGLAVDSRIGPLYYLG